MTRENTYGHRLSILLICNSKIATKNFLTLLDSKPEYKVQVLEADSIETLPENPGKGFDIVLCAAALSKDILLEATKRLHTEKFAGSTILLVANSEEVKDVTDEVMCNFNGLISIDTPDSDLIIRQIGCYAIGARTLSTTSESARQFRGFFDLEGIPGFILDSSFNIMEVSQTLGSHLGLSHPQQLDSKSFSELFSDGRDFKAVTDFYHNGQRDIYQSKVFWTHHKADAIQVNLLLSPRVDNNNKVVGYLGTARDVARDDKASRQERRQENLEKTYRFTRSLAHEIKNPLTTIDLAIDGLQDFIPEGNENRDYLNIISRSSKRINLLLDELLSSSKSGGLQLVAYPFNDFMEETLRLLDDRLELSEITLKTSLTTDSELTCLIDYSKMQIAVTNILINAVEAAEKNKGIIEVSTKRLNGEVLITVTDSGPGISIEERNYVFDPFYSSKKSGVGLGLTMSQSIITEHRGSIDLESSSGKGSTFTITLPVYTDK